MKNLSLDNDELEVLKFILTKSVKGQKEQLEEIDDVRFVVDLAITDGLLRKVNELFNI